MEERVGRMAPPDRPGGIRFDRNELAGAFGDIGTDLPLIVTAPKAWPHFKNFFDRPSWFQELVNELNVSRRVAAHMNPLEDDDVKNVEAAFRKWAKLMKAKADLIP